MQSASPRSDNAMKEAVVRTVFLALILMLLVPIAARAHCDALDGPVVAGARAALTSGDPKPALAWVGAGDEEEVLRALERARAVRGSSKPVREIVDLWFYETVVRLHRASEGEPYTGLKPAGQTPEVLLEADAAIRAGDAAALEAHLTGAMRAELQERFERVMAAKAIAGKDVASARQYTHAYVELMHFVEGVGHAASHEKPLPSN